MFSSAGNRFRNKTECYIHGPICVDIGPWLHLIVQELCESPGVRPNEPSGFRGRKAILNHASALVLACP